MKQKLSREMNLTNLPEVDNSDSQSRDVNQEGRVEISETVMID